MEDGRYLLHHAADYGQREVIEYLLSQGASVNVSLADYGQKAVIEYLLSQGADVNVSLADYGQKAVIEYLLSKSANVNVSFQVLDNYTNVLPNFLELVLCFVQASLCNKTVNFNDAHYGVAWCAWCNQ